MRLSPLSPCLLRPLDFAAIPVFIHYPWSPNSTGSAAEVKDRRPPAFEELSAPGGGDMSEKWKCLGSFTERPRDLSQDI